MCPRGTPGPNSCAPKAPYCALEARGAHRTALRDPQSTLQSPGDALRFLRVKQASSGGKQRKPPEPPKGSVLIPGCPTEPEGTAWPFGQMGDRLGEPWIPVRSPAVSAGGLEPLPRPRGVGARRGAAGRAPTDPPCLTPLPSIAAEFRPALGLMSGVGFSFLPALPPTL